MQKSFVAEDQRKISETIRKIIALGLKWVPVRAKARTAVNAFYDPTTKNMYTTFTSGYVQREHVRKAPEGFEYHKGYGSVQSQINKRVEKYITTTYGDSTYTNLTYVMILLPTELERLERTLECLTTVRKRQAKK